MHATNIQMKITNHTIIHVSRIEIKWRYLPLAFALCQSTVTNTAARAMLVMDVDSVKFQ
jgi:hypothetical protein